MVTVSIIAPIYDAPRSLKFCILGYQRQSVKDFELIIADDGSGDETKELIENFRRSSPFPIKHVWQENKGFRKARIVNEGVKVSEGRILILTDGDCIPHRDLVKSHIENCKKNSFCAGAYILMPYEYCAGLTDEMVVKGDYERFLTIWKKLRLTFRHWRNALHIAMKRARYPKINGRNFSVWRDDFYAVNGFDEDFVGIGGEEPDLRNRLLRSGAKPTSLWNKSFVFHIDHVSETTRKSHPPRDRERSLAMRRRAEIPIRCENGLIKESL